MKRKVLAYITRGTGDDRQLLVFEQKGHPEAGTQVPGGTIEEGEMLIDALFREIEEETGILRDDLILLRKLHTYLYFRENKGVYERNLFHLSYIGEIRPNWEHVVYGGGEDDGMTFCLRWIPLNNVPALAVDQDVALDLI